MSKTTTTSPLAGWTETQIANTRLDLALAAGTFMRDIPDEDVATRLRETEGAKP